MTYDPNYGEHAAQNEDAKSDHAALRAWEAADHEEIERVYNMRTPAMMLQCFVAACSVRVSIDLLTNPHLNF
jgi:hypothetical protein